MHAIPNRYELGRAPLLGHNLVRLLYLDESGSDHQAPVLNVAGVLVHGDKEWPEIDRRVLLLIDKYRRFYRERRAIWASLFQQ